MYQNGHTDLALTPLRQSVLTITLLVQMFCGCSESKGNLGILFDSLLHGSTKHWEGTISCTYTSKKVKGKLVPDTCYIDQYLATRGTDITVSDTTVFCQHSEHPQTLFQVIRLGLATVSFASVQLRRKLSYIPKPLSDLGDSS